MSAAGGSAGVGGVPPEGSIVAAHMPVAVGAGNVEVSQRVADGCLGAARCLDAVRPHYEAAIEEGVVAGIRALAVG